MSFLQSTRILYKADIRLTSYLFRLFEFETAYIGKLKGYLRDMLPSA